MERSESNRTDVLSRWVGHTAIDRSGDKVGKITDLYVDVDTGQPEWLAVSTGLFGTRVSFVPVTGADEQGDDIVLAWDKSTVKDAPNADADGRLSPEDEDRLYAHYQFGREAAWDTGTGVAEGRTTGREVTDADRPWAAGDTNRADDAMTRSEEELDITARQRAGGQRRARLEKWVETEHVQTTVPVTRERARIVTEPIDDANVDRAMSGPDLTSSEHEVVLREEEVDVQKRVVPKERVRLEKESITEDVPVDEEVRKERIELRDDGRSSR